MRQPAIAILSSGVGNLGGAAKATLLLCLALRRLNRPVCLFVTLPPEADTAAVLAAGGVQVVTPRVSRGWRLAAPQRSIAAQLFWWARRVKPAAILAVSLSPEARYLLRLSSTVPIDLWETTEALPHVKFVDRGIACLLSRAHAVLAPSKTVADNVRSTYGYSGPIELLPFWVEPPEGPTPLPTTPPTGKLLYVGRLDIDKGFAYLFDAVRQVRRRHPELQLVVRGPGPTAPLLELAGDEPGIVIRGYADREEWEAEIRGC